MFSAEIDLVRRGHPSECRYRLCIRHPVTLLEGVYISHSDSPSDDASIVHTKMVYSKESSEICSPVPDALGIQSQFRILNFLFINRVISRHYEDTSAGPFAVEIGFIMRVSVKECTPDVSVKPTLKHYCVRSAPCTRKLKGPYETERPTRVLSRDQPTPAFSYVDHIESYPAAPSFRAR